ncbi:MAG: [Fe-Fe] hydrogenase large subunit C-terminal domain-containing protein, partial [Spirochaetaceae bacterium]
MTSQKKTVKETATVNNIEVPIEGERNILELVRKAGIDLPTFCYHSELSLYGACRLCIVEVEGKGIVASCCEPPRKGMVIKTATRELREMRKMNLELLLANHDYSCPSCERAGDCRLQDLANKLGVRDIRFRRTRETAKKDELSDSLVRDPNKCILCGDCVRYCAEIQGIGAIDFAYRGEEVRVTPAFNKSLSEVDCVNCGQCAAVCPTGAIVPKSEVEAVLADLENPNKLVAVQVAPAVPAAFGEIFGMEGKDVGGLMATALRMVGFDRIYSTAFGADMTVLEESAEFLGRREKGDNLPLFTSCCPAWVEYAEQYYPELLKNLSSCMSPQTMVGSIAGPILREEGALDGGKELSVVSIMPCTAKKFEKNRPELSRDDRNHVNHVLTTRELGSLLKMFGIRFEELLPSAMDLPMAYSSGAGTIFANAGGVAEAVVRYTGDTSIRVLTVQGLGEAGKVAESVKKGECEYDLIEVMACPGGCIGGAGQPVGKTPDTLQRRAEVLKTGDRMQAIHNSVQNPFLLDLYTRFLGEKPGSPEAHSLLHTTYTGRKRIDTASFSLLSAEDSGKEGVDVSICVGTSCFVKGSQSILQRVLAEAEKGEYAGALNVQAAFCSENCDKGPTVRIGERVIHEADPDTVIDTIKEVVAEHGGIRDSYGDSTD